MMSDRQILADSVDPDQTIPACLKTLMFSAELNIKK